MCAMSFRVSRGFDVRDVIETVAIVIPCSNDLAVAGIIQE